MKKLFALLFSFQLIVTPVFAAGTQNVPGTEEDAYLTTGTGAKGKNGGYDFYVSQIMALATSAVGTSLITNCTTAFKVPSLMILFTGSVAHMASEMLGAKSSNEDHKKRFKDLEIKEAELKSKGDISQKAVLEERLKEEKATLKFLNNRLIWMTAITAIYGTALGFAIAETSIHYIPPTPATPNPFYQFFMGTCKGGGDAKGIQWGTVISLAYGMGASKLGNGGAVSQYGSMLISLLNMAVPTMSKTIGKLYDQPAPRIATIGVAAGLALAITTGLGLRAKKAKENIGKLEKVIAQFKANSENSGTSLDTGSASGSDDDMEDTIGNKSKIKELVETKKKQCLSISNGTADMSEAACGKKLNITQVKAPNGFNLPTMNKVSTLSADMANALASGDDALAGSLAGEIGSYAARVQTELDAVKKAYNEDQKKNKKPEIDFDKSVKEQVAALQGTINDAAKSSNINLAEAAGSNKLDEETPAKDETPVVTTAAPVPAPEIPVDPFAGMGGTEEMDLPEAKTVAAAQSLDDFESTEQDIAKTPETSIFKQLSNRYILNYKKMFETKKSLDPQSPTPTN